MQVMSRVPGVTVTPHHSRIEEKPLDFYEQFHVIILGLDSLEARRYMNSVACSLLGEFSTWSYRGPFSRLAMLTHLRQVLCIFSSDDTPAADIIYLLL